MGRVKVRIRKLETAFARKNTFSKRKPAIMRKVDELSILCDIDVLLLMFSPAGKPILSLGENSELSTILAKYALLDPQERAKRKCDSLELLKRMCEKINHEIDIEAYNGRKQKLEALRSQLVTLQSQITDAHYRLSYWTTPEKVNNLVQIREMEESLVKSLGQLRERKEQFSHLPDHRIAPRPNRDAERLMNPRILNPNIVPGVELDFQYQCQRRGLENLYHGVDRYTNASRINPVQHEIVQVKFQGSLSFPIEKHPY